MVTDVILSGLTNLFALFGANKNIDVNESKDTLNKYLIRHFGVRNVSVYLEMYEELLGLYKISVDLDKETMVAQICENLSSQLTLEEQALVLLRLMEFCDTPTTDFNPDEFVFRKVAVAFGVNDELYDEFCRFTDAIPSEQTIILKYDNLDGYVKVMWLKEYNKFVFSYLGNDEVLYNDVPVLFNVFQTWNQSGVLKVLKTGVRLYYSAMLKEFAPDSCLDDIEFCGRNVNFRFPDSDNGMHDLNFTLHSGQMLAIMGGSGTGKTTLLSLLNGSLKPQEGSITINGHDINEDCAKALIGFVPQDDLLIEELTVYQNLWYTAKLCFSGMSDEDIDGRVMDVLKHLGLDIIKDLKVGSAIKKTISGGQRKRLNIALELIREPAILFLDEPTSGLSSSDTETVINLLKEQTYKGRLVVVNIHQPSSEVYKLFDCLWILDKGGYPVFDGNPIEAITYFKSAANYVDSETSMCPVCGNVNPEIVLNIIDEKSLDSSGNISSERKVSPQEWHTMYLDGLQESVKSEIVETDIPETHQKRPNAWRQFGIFLRRNISSKITNLQYLLIALLEAPVLTCICAMLTHYSPTGQDYSLMENKNVVIYMFMAVIVAIFIGMSGSAEEIIKDRALLKREKFLNLSYFSYISSKIVFMAVVVLVQTFLFVLIGNGILGLPSLTSGGPLFINWWMILFVSAFLAGLTGLLLSQNLNSVVSIYITIPILLIPQILLCGLVVDFSDLTPKSTTGNVPVIGNLIPSRWSYEALAVSQFCNNDFVKNTYPEAKEKYESQYYRLAFLYELETQLETMHDEEARGKEINPSHMLVIKTEIGRLAEVADMPVYQGNYSYMSLKDYFHCADSLLAAKGNKAALAEDRKLVGLVKQYGKDNYLQLKKDDYNLQLENVVLNADTKHTHDVVDGYIVPRVGFIYLTPRTTNGNAPFYSSTKLVGTHSIPTLVFNMLVLLAMSLVAITLLLLDLPGRYIRS